MLVNFTRRTDTYRFPLHELALSGQIYPWSMWSSSRCGIVATHTACSRACCLGWICNIQTLHSTSARQLRIEMIYIKYRLWSVRRIYKYVVSLRQLWVRYKKRHVPVRYYFTGCPLDANNIIRFRAYRRSIWYYPPRMPRETRVGMSMASSSSMKIFNRMFQACMWSYSLDLLLPGLWPPHSSAVAYFSTLKRPSQAPTREP